MGDLCPAHVGAGNQFRATAIASKDPSAVYVLKDKNVPYYEPSDTIQFMFFMEIF